MPAQAPSSFGLDGHVDLFPKIEQSHLYDYNKYIITDRTYCKTWTFYKEFMWPIRCGLWTCPDLSIILCLSQSHGVLRMVLTAFE